MSGIRQPGAALEPPSRARAFSSLRVVSAPSRAALVASVLVVTATAAQFAHVYSETGTFAISVPEARAPGRVHVDGRDYARGDQVGLPADAVATGRTPGGGLVYKPDGDEDHLSVVIYVAAGQDAWTYGLIGGP